MLCKYFIHKYKIHLLTFSFISHILCLVAVCQPLNIKLLLACLLTLFIKYFKYKIHDCILYFKNTKYLSETCQSLFHDTIRQLIAIMVFIDFFDSFNYDVLNADPGRRQSAHCSQLKISNRVTTAHTQAECMKSMHVFPLLLVC